MKGKNRRGLFLIFAGLLLIAAALFLSAHNLLEACGAEKASDEVASALSAAIPGYGGEDAGGAMVMDAVGGAVETAVDDRGNPVQPDGAAWPRDASGELDLAIEDVRGAWIPWPLDASGTPLSPTLDGGGTAIEWPMDEGGAPVPWPLDENGFPISSIADWKGVLHEWPSGAVGLPEELAGQGSFALLPSDAQGRVLSQMGSSEHRVAWPVDGDGNLIPLLYADGTRAAPWPLDRQGRILSAAMAFLHRKETIRALELASQPLYVRNPDMEMPVIEVDGNSYIGVLDIPSKGLSLPVMSEWNYAKLRIAPCRYSGSVYNGSIVIAGHNYARHFGPVKRLNEGDEVVFTDVDGNVFHYEVAVVETLKSTAVQEMIAGDWDLTLFTCTYGGVNRAAVRCKRIEEK